jgi:hypothetical protein
MCLHTLHLFLWRIVEENDFRQVYDALLPTLVQLRSNLFGSGIIRNIMVGDEIVEVAGWPWQLPALMLPPQSLFQWAPSAGVLWPPLYVARPAILPVIEPPPPQIPQHPEELPVRAVRERAAMQLLRARLLYVRCYSRYANSFWVYATLDIQVGGWKLLLFRCLMLAAGCKDAKDAGGGSDAGDTTDPLTNDPVTESHRGLVGSLHGESNLSISSLFYYTESCLESLESNPLSPSHLLNLAMYVVNNIKQSVLIASNLRVVLL